MRTTTTSLLTLFAAGALARTDLVGCTSSKTIAYGGASMVWYVPGTGELCEFLDCGGGRAPPKTTVPGCAAYSGTATYSPNYLPGYGPDAAPTSSAVASSAVVSSSAAAVSPSVTAAPSLSSAAVSSETAAKTSSAAADDEDDDNEDDDNEDDDNEDDDNEDDDNEDDDSEDVEGASASASASSSSSSSASSTTSAFAWTGLSNMVYSIATPGASQHSVATPSTTPAAATSTPAAYTGAAVKVEAAAGVAFGGVVAALAWL